jgi:K+-sensing histidine kinase KdpD
MSRHSRGPVTDAVFVFDGRGRRCASSAGSDAALRGPVRTIDELGAKFRMPDGRPLELDVAGTHVGVGVNGLSGERVAITAEPVQSEDGDVDEAGPATIVTVRAFRDEDDPATLRLALGSILAHELRTPMTTIFGGAQLIASPGTSEETRVEAASAVARQTAVLNAIVENLVALVRLGGERPDDREPLRLQHVLNRFVEAERARHPGSRIDLDIPADVPAVLTAGPLLEHVLRNLVDHALLYAPRDATVRLRARKARREVEIAVIDDGPTRDEGDARGAFDLFHRSRRTSADPSGANLALVVARRLVEAAGGRISARVASAGGEIVVALPIAREA